MKSIPEIAEEARRRASPHMILADVSTTKVEQVNEALIKAQAAAIRAVLDAPIKFKDGSRTETLRDIISDWGDARQLAQIISALTGESHE